MDTQMVLKTKSHSFSFRASLECFVRLLGSCQKWWASV